MFFLTYFFAYLTNLSYLFTDPTLPTKKKLGIYFYYTYLLLHIPFRHLLKNTSVVFGKKAITTQSFLNMFILYGETQVKREYYFHTAEKSPVIFDVGANVGATTLFFKELYPDALIHCFEPDTSSFSQLQHNLSWIQSIKLNNIAVSHTNEGITFYSDESASLANSQYESRGWSHKITVPSTTLSTYIAEQNIQKIDLLKIDIEWWEWDVFSDMKNHNLFGIVEEMIIEYHHHIKGLDMSFADFLHTLEDNWFSYQLTTRYYPLPAKDIFQDIYIRAYKHG